MQTTSSEPMSVNEAGLYLYSELKELSLWAQAIECYQCDLVEWKPVSKQPLFYIFDPQFEWNLELRCNTNNTLVTSEFSFKEHAIYNWNYTSHGSSIQLVKLFTDPYIPIYVIIAALVIGTLLWRLSKWLFRRSASLRRILRLLSTTEEIENDLGSPEEANELIATYANAPQREHHRIRSLDVFRGVTICSMIFVNYGGGSYSFLQHSAWNGLTFADVIFPWFAWIMGMSIALKVKAELRNSVNRKLLVRKLARRSSILIVLGIILTNLSHDDVSTMRIPGVLQRLGITYFVVGTLETVFMTPQPNSENSSNNTFLDFEECWKQWIIVVTLVVIHTCLTFLVRVSGCPMGYLGPGGRSNHSANENCTGGVAGFIDRQLFPTANHIYQRPTCEILYECRIPYDPEGLLGTLTTVLCVYSGVHAGRILQVYKHPSQRLTRWLLFSTIYVLAALILCNFSVEEGIIPLNKNLWSLSYVLMCTGLAFLIFSILYTSVDKMKWWKGSPFYQTGMNSLVLYIGHIICKDTFPWRWKPGLLNPMFHTEPVIMDLWATTLWILIAVILYKRKIFIAV